MLKGTKSDGQLSNLLQIFIPQLKQFQVFIKQMPSIQTYKEFSYCSKFITMYLKLFKELTDYKLQRLNPRDPNIHAFVYKSSLEGITCLIKLLLSFDNKCLFQHTVEEKLSPCFKMTHILSNLIYTPIVNFHELQSKGECNYLEVVRSLIHFLHSIPTEQIFAYLK